MGFRSKKSYFSDSRTKNSIFTVDPGNGKVIDNTEDQRGNHWVSSLAIDNDGHWMVCGSGNNLITLWSTPYPTLTSAMITMSNPNSIIFDSNKVEKKM